MKNCLYILLCLSLLSVQGCSIFKKRKSPEPEKEQLSEYEKFLKDNKVSTRGGWITTHMAKDKCYVEFPAELLGTDMFYTTSIEDTSDNREGAVGQFSDNGVLVYFTLREKELLAHMRLLMPVNNETGDMSLNKALDMSNSPGVWKRFKIEAWNPDSTAMVVDMTKFFIEHNEYASPFPSVSSSTMLGFKARKHKLVESGSYPARAKCCGNTLMVECKMQYTVDIYTLGTLSEKDMPVNITVNKMLSLLPADVMTPRLADSRVGAAPSYIKRINGEMKIEDIPYVKRWRIEPSDPQAYSKGEIVDPQKPIIFHIDSLMPETWKPYVIEGVTEWNKAFEKIGFKNVVQVVDYPKNDSTFNANSIEFSKIIYAPLWLYNPTVSTLSDPRSGEILNSAILLPSNFTSILQRNRTVATMGADPEVRRAQFTDEQMGSLIRSSVMQYAGMSLGLLPNTAGSSAYPVDSLRSPSFTREWGITASIMDNIAYNYVAQPEDVANGVLMEPLTIGPYDYYAINWVYKPIPGINKPEDEIPVLNKWIEEKANDPVYRYYVIQYMQNGFDPSALSGDVGDDPIRAAELYRENWKTVTANFYDWFREEDKDITYRESLYAFIGFGYSGKLNNVMSLIGGIYRNDIKEGDPRPAFEVVSRERQKEAVKYIIETSRAIDWVNDVGNRNMMGISAGTTLERPGLLGSLLGRTARLAVCVEKDPSSYSPEELVQDIYNEVFKKTLRSVPLDWKDIKLQQDLLGAIIATAGVSPSSQNAGGAAANPRAASAVRTISGVMPTAVSASHPAFVDEVPYVTDFLANVDILLEQYNSSSLYREETSDIGSVYGFEPSMREIKANRYPVSHVYYDMLLKTRNLIRTRVGNSSGDTLAHYKFMLFKINQVLGNR